MFKTKIISFQSIVYEGFADRAFFNVQNVGQVGILAHHIECEFQVVPSICYVFSYDKKYMFYIGYGFAKFEDNSLFLTSNIITTRDEYISECEKFEEYGNICRKNFKEVLF